MKTSATKVYDQLDYDIVLVATQYQSFTRPGTFSRRRLFEAQSVDGVQAHGLLFTLGSTCGETPPPL